MTLLCHEQEMRKPKIASGVHLGKYRPVLRAPFCPVRVRECYDMDAKFSGSRFHTYPSYTTRTSCRRLGG
jgi:hypothetical protein